MKKIFVLILIVLIVGCSNVKKEKSIVEDDKDIKKEEVKKELTVEDYQNNKVNELAIKYPVLVSQYNALKDKFDSPKKGGRS